MPYVYKPNTLHVAQLQKKKKKKKNSMKNLDELQSWLKPNLI